MKGWGSIATGAGSGSTATGAGSSRDRRGLSGDRRGLRGDGSRSVGNQPGGLLQALDKGRASRLGGLRRNHRKLGGVALVAVELRLELINSSNSSGSSSIAPSIPPVGT